MGCPRPLSALSIWGISSPLPITVWKRLVKPRKTIKRATSSMPLSVASWTSCHHSTHIDSLCPGHLPCRHHSAIVIAMQSDQLSLNHYLTVVFKFKSGQSECRTLAGISSSSRLASHSSNGSENEPAIQTISLAGPWFSRQDFSSWKVKQILSQNLLQWPCGSNPREQNITFCFVSQIKHPDNYVNHFILALSLSNAQIENSVKSSANWETS